MEKLNDKYELNKIIKLIPMQGLNNDKLIELYFQKNNAVFFEDYEFAINIKKEIETLEKKKQID